MSKGGVVTKEVVDSELKGEEEEDKKWKDQFVQEGFAVSQKRSDES